MKKLLMEYVKGNFDDEKRNDRFGNALYRTLADTSFFYLMKEKFNLIGSIDCYVGYAYNDDCMALMTYTEGDYYFKFHSDIRTYEQDKVETIQWYKEN